MDGPKYAEKYADKYAKMKYARKYVSKIEGLKCISFCVLLGTSTGVSLVSYEIGVHS